MAASNSPLGTYVGESLSTRTQFWKVAKRVSFITPFVLGGAFYLVLWRYLDFVESKFMFSLSMTAIALVLAGTYFSSYKFFEENFYYFIFVSWITNAIYLIPELNGPARGHDNYFTFKAIVIALSLTSSLFLGLALLTRAQKENSKPTWKDISYSSWAGLVATALLYLGIAYFLISGSSPSEPAKARLAIWMLPGSALSFLLLWAVGTALKNRLRNTNPRWIGRILWGSFVVYAILQFSYPFTLFIKNHLPLFLVAQLAKVVNAITMTGVLVSAIAHKESEHFEVIRNAENEVRIKRAELKAEEARLRGKGRFVELGMLASAIKHDVQTPLATMGFDLQALKERFQGDQKLKRRLESLMESMDRIGAIVKVVDIFRGDKAFFDRDHFMGKASMLEVASRAVRSVKNEKEELKQDKPATRIKVTGHEVWVRAYVPMLEQVLVNIIKNGLEGIEEAERRQGLVTINVGTAEIANSQFSKWVKVEIEDNGCGIPPENMDKLTTIFTTRGEKKPNSGIGLFIGKKVLDIHDGEIEFVSTVGEGTVVTLLLPEWNALRKKDGELNHKTDDPLHDSRDSHRKLHHSDEARKPEMLPESSANSGSESGDQK